MIELYHLMSYFNSISGSIKMKIVEKFDEKSQTIKQNGVHESSTKI